MKEIINKKNVVKNKVFEIESLKKSNIQGIIKIENESFTHPWTEADFVKELDNENANYLVCVEDGEVLGYIGFWKVLNEGHINNIAVAQCHRNRGVASFILEQMLEGAKELGIDSFTLEVRVSNEIAISLYKKFGFKEEGIRKRYYDNKEDALIMWKLI